MKTLVTSRSDVASLLEKIANANVIGFDTESAGPPKPGSKKKFINIYRANMVGMSFAFEDHSMYYVPIAHHVGKNATLADARKLAAATLAAPRVLVHNLKHEIHTLRSFMPGSMVEGNGFLCSQVLCWLLDQRSSHKKKYFALKELARTYLNMEMNSFEDTVGAKGSFAAVNPAQGIDYACDDALATLRLWGMFYSKLSDKQRSTLHDIEMPFQYVLADMEQAGMRLDERVVSQVVAEIDDREAILEEQWCALAPGVAISSPTQVADVMYSDDFGPALWVPVPKAKRGKSGRYSVDREAMEYNLYSAPTELGRKLAEIRMEYGMLDKVRGTYTQNLVDMQEDYPDGKLHCSFNGTGTQTGRLSSDGPNLQNIPVKTDVGRRIREAFIPDDGHVFVSADFSQIELRMLAHFAKKGSLFDAYAEGLDVHQQTATLVGCTRDQGKTLNFATVYGAQKNKLAKMLNVSSQEAAGFLRQFREVAYPEVDKTLKSIARIAYERGEVRTLLGKVRKLPELVAANRRDSYQETDEERLERWSGERKAKNTPIQGGAADVVKVAMLNVARRLRSELPASKMLAQVHDELLVQAPKEQAEEVSRLLQTEMVQAGKQLGLRVPLVAEPKISSCWSK